MPRTVKDPVLNALLAFEYKPAEPEAPTAWPPPVPDPFASREAATRFAHDDLPKMPRDELLAELILAALAVRTTTSAWWAERWAAVRTEWRRRYGRASS